MGRLEKVKEYVNDIINNHCFLPEKSDIIIHLYGVSSTCALLAIKRGLDQEIASVSGLLHDIYACWTGSYLFHEHSGAEMARVALRRMDCFTEEEQMLIQSAIFHHGDKEHVHDPYDELLKDADILQPFLQNAGQRLFFLGEPRMRCMAAELGIPFEPVLFGQQNDCPGTKGNRSKLADIAEEMANQNIEGSLENGAFQDILRYWPEKEAFEELKNAWCAAFVYHCSIIAGIKLPIKYPGIGARFAGVGPWLEWARLNGFYYDNHSKFSPARGDIVIYNNIISVDKKPSDSLWHDHIGIVLAIDAGTLMVAEGNVGNDNVSGVLNRKQNENIGGFIRIPDDYEYDGWKYDYKTKEVRTTPFIIE